MLLILPVVARHVAPFGGICVSSSGVRGVARSRLGHARYRTPLGPSMPFRTERCNSVPAHLAVLATRAEEVMTTYAPANHTLSPTQSAQRRCSILGEAKLLLDPVVRGLAHCLGGAAKQVRTQTQQQQRASSEGSGFVCPSSPAPGSRVTA